MFNVYINLFKYHLACFFKDADPSFIILNIYIEQLNIFNMLLYRPDPPTLIESRPKSNPVSAFFVRSGSTSTPNRPKADTEQTQKEHRTQTLFLLADIKVLQIK